MARNLFREFTDLLPPRVLQVGTVTVVDGGICTIELPGGGLLQVRGDAAVSDRVFVRDGLIESQAPSLPIVVIEV